MILLLSLSLLACTFTSCKSKSSVAKQMDKIHERQEAGRKEATAAYESALKRHESIQSKGSKKMMKQSRKKAGRWMKKNIKNVPNCPATH